MPLNHLSPHPHSHACNPPTFKPLSIQPPVHSHPMYHPKPLTPSFTSATHPHATIAIIFTTPCYAQVQTPLLTTSMHPDFTLGHPTLSATPSLLTPPPLPPPLLPSTCVDVLLHESSSLGTLPQLACQQSQRWPSLGSVNIS